jgi:conserved oligomeric Golgi complex subunit 6
LDVEENDVALGLGLRTMRERPALYLHCQECLLQRRRDVVRRRFLLALTQGGGDGRGGMHAPGAAAGARPIDMQAHDPVRYLGDILAWLHQTVASEREFLLNLLGGEGASSLSASSSFGEQDDDDDDEGEGQEGGAEQQQQLQLKKEELSLGAILEGIMDGVAPLLRARILQLLDASSSTTTTAPGEAPAGRGVGTSGSGSGMNMGMGMGPQQQHLVLHFRLLNLLAFYDATFRGPKVGLGASQLAAAVRDARGQCQRLFEAGLRRVGEAALESPPAITMDLGAAAVTQEAGRVLGEVLAVHATSLLPPDESASAASYALDDVLAALVEPILRACRLGAEGLLDPSDAAVYMLNNAAALRASLEGHAAAAPAAASWLTKLQGEMEAWLATLVRYQSDAVLERSGLGTLLERAAAVAEAEAGGGGGGGAPLSSQPGLDGATVAQVMKGFYSGLFALPQFERLQTPSLRGGARQRTAVLIAEAHEKAHALLDRPENGYTDRASFLFHTPEQVRILLDCD